MCVCVCVCVCVCRIVSTDKTLRKINTLIIIIIIKTSGKENHDLQRKKCVMRVGPKERTECVSLMLHGRAFHWEGAISESLMALALCYTVPGPRNVKK